MPKSAAMRHQRLHHRVAGAAGEGRGHFAAPPGQLGGGDAGVADLVDHVVDLAAERVEGGDRRAPRRRQEQEGVVEARAAARGLVLHVLLRASSRSSARRADRRGAHLQRAPEHDRRHRRVPGVGRVARSSRSPAPSILSRMRKPALHHQAQLPAGAAGHAGAPAARPASISSRAQSHRSRDQRRGLRAQSLAAQHAGRRPRRGARSRTAAGRAGPRGRSTPGPARS